MKPTTKRRLFYLLLFAILVAIEALIAAFVHDSFVRPYLGDVLVVVVLYCFVRIFIPENVILLPFYVFLFAAVVEFSQLFHLAALFGLHSRFFQMILGASFDVIDLFCYAIGCILLAGWEIWQHKRI